MCHQDGRGNSSVKQEPQKLVVYSNPSLIISLSIIIGHLFSILQRFIPIQNTKIVGESTMLFHYCTTASWKAVKRFHWITTSWPRWRHDGDWCTVCRPLAVTTENAECWVRRVEAATWWLVNRSHAAHIHPQTMNQINVMYVDLPRILLCRSTH